MLQMPAHLTCLHASILLHPPFPRSWREFPHPDEEDVEGAESREHRRWIERQNSKLREKGERQWRRGGRGQVAGESMELPVCIA